MRLFLILPLALLAISAPDVQVAVLPEKEAARLADQCSREAPPSFRLTWSPSQEDLASLKKHLPELVGVASTRCCNKGGRIRSLEGLKLQVVGVIVPGPKRLVYVNAVPPRWSDRWRTEAVVICDGGEAFWGVLFDPAVGTFSELAFNGVG